MPWPFVAARTGNAKRHFPRYALFAMNDLTSDLIEKAASLLGPRGVIGDPADIAPWVTDWLTSRRQKSEKKVAAASQNRETADPEAAAKRTAKRLARMKEGGEELARWLADQVRGGFCLALLQSNHAQKVQGVRAIWIGGQDLAVQRGRLLQLSACMQPHGFGEHHSNIGICQYWPLSRSASQHGTPHVSAIQAPLGTVRAACIDSL